MVRLGDLDLKSTSDDAKPQEFKVERIVIHPGYQPPAKYHDIAIIELDKVANRTLYVDVACLVVPKNDDKRVYKVSGWGKTEFAGMENYSLAAFLCHIIQKIILVIVNIFLRHAFM